MTDIQKLERAYVQALRREHEIVNSLPEDSRGNGTATPAQYARAWAAADATNTARRALQLAREWYEIMEGESSCY